MKRAEFEEHYHKRSNVEATYHMIKSKFGGHVRDRRPHRWLGGRPPAQAAGLEKGAPQPWASLSGCSSHRPET